MKSITFSIFLIAILIFSVGCDSTVCTDSFCIVPRDDVDGEVIEVDETKVLALIGKTSEPELITLEPLPSYPPVPIIPDTLFADVISDVAAGNTTYLDQTVIINAAVRFKFAHMGTLALETNTDDVFFFITDRDNPENLHGYAAESRYNFKIYIRSILAPDEDFDDYAVYSHIVE